MVDPQCLLRRTKKAVAAPAADAPPRGRPLAAVETGEAELNEALRPASDTPTVLPGGDQAPSASRVDAAVQCDVEEMLEPIFRSPVFQRKAVRQLRESPLDSGPAHSLAKHFSCFTDVTQVAAWGVSLSKEEICTLADLFLGSHIAGVEVKRRSHRPPRCVPGRFVQEAGALSAHAQFRSALIASAWRLLVRGLGRRPLESCGLLLAAVREPDEWGLMAQIALHFIASLISAGVLPQALIAELLAAAADVTGVREARWARGGPPAPLASLLVACKGLVPVSRPAGAGPHLAGSALQPRAAGVAPQLAEPPAGPLAARRVAARVAPGIRSVGTTLHVNADLQPYSRVSVQGASNKRPGASAETIPLEISPADLTAYWKGSSAGSAEQLGVETASLQGAAGPATR